MDFRCEKITDDAVECLGKSLKSLDSLNTLNLDFTS